MSERRQTHPDLSLAGHRGSRYDKGRSLPWQASWFFVQNTVFMAWWCPKILRPALLRLFGANIGQRVYIRDGVRIHWPWRLAIGDDVWIGQGAQILNLAPVTIGSDTCLSQESFLIAGGHDPSSVTFEHRNEPIQIGRGVWVCARAIVLGGAHVADHTIVPANAVVRPSRPRPAGAPTGTGAQAGQGDR